MTTKIDKLTPEQEALIPVYRERWRAIALSTERIDRQKATEAVQAVYRLLEQKEPRFFVFTSPFAALEMIVDNLNLPASQQVNSSSRKDFIVQLIDYLGQPIWMKVKNQIELQLEKQLSHQLSGQLWNRLDEQLLDHENKYIEDIFEIEQSIEFFAQLRKSLCYQMKCRSDLLKFLAEEFSPRELSACIARQFDFCISALNCHVDQKRWAVYQTLIETCGWIYPCEKVCFICDRPTKISFDSENRLHAEGEPAIQFADGFSVYAHHGKLIQVGEQWQQRLLD